MEITSFLLICCVVNILIIAWEFRLDYKENGVVEKTISEICIYLVAILISVLGTLMLILMMIQYSTDNPIKYVHDRLHEIVKKPLTILRKK